MKPTPRDEYIKWVRRHTKIGKVQHYWKAYPTASGMIYEPWKIGVGFRAFSRISGASGHAVPFKGSPLWRKV
jgi:hypothetical protein